MVQRLTILSKEWFKMTANKRKKNSRQRGSHTHGWGSKKKHRGAGHRGGRGNAGTGKRADAKKPCIWKDKKYFGRHGFHCATGIKVRCINLKTLHNQLKTLVENKLASIEKEVYTVDLVKLGYDKLLGSGKVTQKLNVTISSASPKAIEKVKNAGGEVKVAKSE